MRAVRNSFFVAALAMCLAGVARAEIVIKIDKTAQRMTVSRDGVMLYTWPVSTGRNGYETPSGSFTAFRMDADHFSKEWDNAPMPHSIFFTKTGIAIHGTYETKGLGAPVSHGCVRLSPEHAATLFSLVKEDGLLTTKVELTGNSHLASARRAIEQAGRSQPLQARATDNGDDTHSYAGDFARSYTADSADADNQATADARSFYANRNGEYWPPVAHSRYPRPRSLFGRLFGGPAGQDDDHDDGQ